MQTASVPQQGGYVKPILLPDIIIGILFAVGISYIESVPTKFLNAADGFLGRVTMFIVIVGFAISGKWILGLLATIFALRLLRYDSTVGSIEPFINQIVTNVQNNSDKKWFIENALNENPKSIEEKIVKTQAVQ